MDGRIFKVKKQILENLQSHWTIDAMASAVELSKPHFQKLFKTEIGISPHVFVNDLRLEKARELLETTFAHIHIIGYEVGLVDDSHFTRDFKKKFGVTPTEYRKRHWEKIQADDLEGHE